MVAADDNRRLDGAGAHQLVQLQAEPRAVALAEPADARRQSLKLHALAGQPDPAAQPRIVGEHLEYGPVGDANVFGVARQGDPAERSLALAEEGADVLRHESANLEGIADAGLDGLRADVVAVVKHDRAALLPRAHGGDVRAHAADRAALVVGRIAGAQTRRLTQREAGRHVADEWVVRRGLVGHDVGQEPAGDQRRQDFGGVAQDADRPRLAVPCALLRPEHGGIEIVGALVEVLRGQPFFDSRWIHLDDQRDAAIHGDGQWLGATHAAQAGRDDNAAAQRPAEMALGHGGERFVGALQDALRADVDPTAGRHLAIHGQPAIFEVAERVPVCPVWHQVGVGNQHARCAGVCPENADRLAGLNNEGFVASQ